jgi:hypothetical protein
MSSYLIVFIVILIIIISLPYYFIYWFTFFELKRRLGFFKFLLLCICYLLILAILTILLSKEYINFFIYLCIFFLIPLIGTHFVWDRKKFLDSFKIKKNKQ